jgi:hypothetical protein
MRKKHLYGLWHQTNNVSLVAVLAAFVISGAVSIYALRANNLHMVHLRQAVYSADQKNGDTKTALDNLREYVYSHMNTNLTAGSQGNEAPIQLVYSYNRAVAAEEARVAALGGTNKVYVDAQAACESEMPNTALPYRAQCVENYITSHSSDTVSLNLPPKELYTFNFVSPFWSPDLAGWSILITAILGLLLVARLITGYIIKKYLKS